VATAVATVALGLFTNWASEEGPNRWVWVAAALATAVLVGLFAAPQLIARLLRRHPVDINVAELRSLGVERMGACWALPVPLRRPDAERATRAARAAADLRKGYDVLGRFLYDSGGAEVNVTARRITFQGTDLPVVIAGMRADVRTRTEVLKGTFVTVGLGGGEKLIVLELDLDEDRPTAGYFEDHVITVSPGESVVIELRATAVRSAVTWDLLIDFVVAGKARTDRLRSEDFLLRTTGLPCHESTHQCHDSGCTTEENYQASAHIGRGELVIPAE
jgi:hypothetical protein